MDMEDSGVGFIDADSVFGQFLTYAPPCLVWVLFAAPLPTMWRIKKEKTTGSLPALIYFMQCFNCVNRCLYGIVTNFITFIIGNGPGLLIGVGYVAVFQYYKPASVSLRKHYTCSALILAGFAVLVTLVDWDIVRNILGSVALLVSILYMGAPLVVIREVIKSRDLRALPLPMAIAGWANATAWLLYGSLLTWDFYVICPNACGMFFATVQILCHIVVPLLPPAEKMITKGRPSASLVVCGEAAVVCDERAVKLGKVELGDEVEMERFVDI